MNLTTTCAIATLLSVGSTLHAGIAIELAPGEDAGGLFGTTNSMMPELRGSEFYDFTHDFVVFDGGAGEGGVPVYEATFMTRIVRSNETGNLHFNYRIIDANDSMNGQVSHVTVSGYEGFDTRVEYRAEAGFGDEGPIDASRDGGGDVIDFDFGGNLDSNESSKFFFAMVDTDSFDADISTVTVYMTNGASVSFTVAGAVPSVPTPGAFALLGLGGICIARRRR